MSELIRQRQSTSLRDRREPADDVELAREDGGKVGKLTAEEAAQDDRSIAPGKVSGDAEPAEIDAAVAGTEARDRTPQDDAGDDDGALASAFGFITPATGPKAAP